MSFTPSMIYPTARPVAGTLIPCYLFDSSSDVARHVAYMVANTIRERNSFGRNAVLGLATGTPLIGVYRELIQMYQEEKLDFRRVITFNLDEFYGLAPDRLQSNRRWMANTFFDHVNITPENIHFLDGTVPPEKVDEHCRQYEEAIRRSGGIDVQLLGLGGNGHIGFNEPFSVRHSRTRLATLDPVTRRSAANDFYSEDNVPTHALTMGVGTLLDARKVVVLGLGENRAKIIRDVAEGPVTDRVPATFLRDHRDASILMDSAAGDELTGVATPWVLGNVDWTEALIKRATLWLCQKTRKALLKLDDTDFREHNLHHLLRHHGPGQKVAHRVFRWMMDTIDHHPAGREPAKILCFSPHPDDDVISMGGTMIRLVEDQHELHVAYMTSGNIAVFDHDVQQLVDLLTELNRRFEIDQDKTPNLENRVLKALAEKRPGEPDVEDVLKFKALIRWSEAKAAATACGCREEYLHFLDLPFYRTGTIDKKAPGEEDVRVVRECIEAVQPKQIYVAGDLTDPHGTHRVCTGIVFQALRQIEQATGTRPDVLLYRGAWQEWPPHAIDVAVPLSPQDVTRKRQAIFRHETQKDTALFPGPDDPREFWQRAEDRNRNTADVYNQTGLPEFYALEAFVRWDGQET
jgi:glucosamine-6-phosphate deaminase